MTRLVLVHGRDLDDHDPELLESQWLAALDAGLAAAGSARRLGDDDASFVYYGDTLAHLTHGTGDVRPPITVHARTVAVDERRLGGLGEHELRFLLAVVRDVLAGTGRSLPTAVPPGAPGPVRAEGLADVLLEALVAGLALLDTVPGVSTGIVLLVARDVYAYLHDDAVRSAIDAGVAAALPHGPAVVVGHSLGAVVAYSVLADREPTSANETPLLLTAGAPLGIRMIREALTARHPLVFPPGVRRWVNARDPRDVLAVHDLTPANFPLPAASPTIEPLHVDNRAPGHHAAAALLGAAAGTPVPLGYLADAAVGTVLDDALPAG